MNHKALLLAVTLIALLSIGGAFWMMQKRPVANQSVVTEPVVETSIQKETAQYPQHIEAIPGNTDEVWYNIPELGVRMKLNKEFAEDLVYSYLHEKNTDLDEEWDAVYFSTKSLTAIDKGCSPEEGNPLGVITKTKGNVSELAKKDEFYSSRLKDIIQIDEYYYMWTGPQATCWNPKNDDAIQKVRSAKDYMGSGTKYVSDGMKTLQLIP